MRVSQKLSKLSPATLEVVRAHLIKEGYAIGEGLTGFDLDFSESEKPEIENKIYQFKLAHIFRIRGYDFLKEIYVFEMSSPFSKLTLFDCTLAN